jgi:hypothetical protein
MYVMQYNTGDAFRPVLADDSPLAHQVCSFAVVCWAGLKQLLERVRMLVQHPCCPLKLAPQEGARLPVHRAPQVVGRVKGVLRAPGAV